MESESRAAANAATKMKRIGRFMDFPLLKNEWSNCQGEDLGLRWPGRRAEAEFLGDHDSTISAAGWIGKKRALTGNLFLSAQKQVPHHAYRRGSE